MTAFVLPATGETFWYVSNDVSKPFFEALLALFAREAGAGRERIIVLGLDNAGWHTEPNLVVPDGIRLVYLPRYSPELQPAEHLWPVLDEPLVNRDFETLTDLEQAVTERCRILHGDQLKPGTNFHWWPKPIVPTGSAGNRMTPAAEACLCKGRWRPFGSGRTLAPVPICVCAPAAFLEP